MAKMKILRNLNTNGTIQKRHYKDKAEQIQIKIGQFQKKYFQMPIQQNIKFNLK